MQKLENFYVNVLSILYKLTNFLFIKYKVENIIWLLFSLRSRPYSRNPKIVSLSSHLPQSVNTAPAKHEISRPLFPLPLTSVVC